MIRKDKDTKIRTWKGGRGKEKSDGTAREEEMNSEKLILLPKKMEAKNKDRIVRIAEEKQTEN